MFCCTEMMIDELLANPNVIHVIEAKRINEVTVFMTTKAIRIRLGIIYN